jgi:hypothetical protein
VDVQLKYRDNSQLLFWPIAPSYREGLAIRNWSVSMMVLEGNLNEPHPYFLPNWPFAQKGKQSRVSVVEISRSYVSKMSSRGR